MAEHVVASLSLCRTANRVRGFSCSYGLLQRPDMIRCRIDDPPRQPMSKLGGGGKFGLPASAAWCCTCAGPRCARRSARGARATGTHTTACIGSHAGTCATTRVAARSTGPAAHSASARCAACSGRKKSTKLHALARHQCVGDPSQDRVFDSLGVSPAKARVLLCDADDQLEFDHEEREALSRTAWQERENGCLSRHRFTTMAQRRGLTPERQIQASGLCAIR